MVAILDCGSHIPWNTIPWKDRHIGGIGSAKCHITKRKIYKTWTENTTILTKFWSRSRFFAPISSMQWQTMLWNVTVVREGCEKYWWWQIWNDLHRNPKWPDWCISGQMEDDLQKSDSYGLKSECEKVPTHFYIVLGMCAHQFGCVLPHGGPSSRWKIDSPIFF